MKMNRTTHERLSSSKRFDSEEQYEIARESIDRAYEAKYGKSGPEDMGSLEEYERFLDLVLANSSEDAFHGTDEEIRDLWFYPEIFE